MKPLEKYQAKKGLDDEEEMDPVKRIARSKKYVRPSAPDPDASYEAAETEAQQPSDIKKLLKKLGS